MPRPKGSKNKNSDTPAEKQSPYSLTIKMFGRLWKASGESFDEALSKLAIKNARSSSVWHLEHDGKQFDKLIGSATTIRYFNTSGVSKEVATKQIKSLFGQI